LLELGDDSMTNGQKLTRDIIIQTLVDGLEPLDCIHAFWEGGAAAFDRIDEWSDIDLYMVVDDDRVSEAFLAVEAALESLSPIRQKYEVLHPPQSGLFQAFYRLEDANEHLVVDLAVLTVSSPDKFLEPEIHGKVVFYFNKADKVKPPPTKIEMLAQEIGKRLKRLQARFDMFNSFIQKEINRGNHLEAIQFYYAVTLNTLIEALRIRYYPLHYDFKMRYIHYELPAEIVRRLKHLYFVEDENDLQEKYHKASKWFHEVMLENNQIDIGKQIGLCVH
jgi:hypothetical protein